ncbi:MAG: hypothetical protein U5N55_06740 [Cypionkella sp.]|nr:hypothetical protein [Cypionkella sp.]
MNNILSVDLIGIALLAVALALVATPLIRSRKGDHSQPAPVVGSEGPVFLFDGDQLIDCNSAARAVLSRSATRGGDWQRLMAFLTLNFQGIDQRLGELAQRGSIAETAEIGNGKVMLLQAELTGGLTRISLDDPDIAEGPGVTLAIAHHALEREVQDLRQAVSSAPVVIWRESVQGDVIWANNAYMLLAASGIARGREMGWPLPRLFDRNTVLNADQKSRQSLTQDSDGTQKAMWYDLIVKQESAGVLCYALPIDAVVTAETNLRDFIDTLAKTFAQLPIGLAVFDKGRVLQMFNPALVELTTLPPDFLALKPSLLAVLDAMRDRNLLPEPKDYRSWRRRVIGDGARCAASGLLTFRKTGPCPMAKHFVSQAGLYAEWRATCPDDRRYFVRNATLAALSVGFGNQSVRDRPSG